MREIKRRKRQKAAKCAVTLHTGRPMKMFRGD